jgi:Dna[CI] antecedent, DciA
MAEKQDFDRLGDLLPETTGAGDTGPGAAQAAGVPGVDLNQRLAAAWADVVGAEVAGNTRPVQLRDGRLVVATSSSAWAQTLQMMSEMIVARLNQRLGQGAIDKAVFRHAGWEDFTLTGAGLPVAASGRRGHHAEPCVRAADVPGDLPAADGGKPGGGPPAAAASATASGPAVGPTDDLDAFSNDEKQALSDLERLPLPPSVKATIRDAMKAGFVRARQDFSR